MTTALIPTRKLADPEVASLVMGQSPPSDTYNTDRIGLPFYQGKTDFGLIHPVPRIWCSAAFRIAEKHDTLVSVRAPVGDVNLANEKCCLGRGVAAIRPTRSTNPKFLFFAVASAKNRLAAFSTGTTFESVNKSALEDLEIPFPKKTEQEKIAAVLWKIQQAIETESKLIATTRELKQSAMRQFFSRGLHDKSQKETDIGTVPESWQQTRIEEFGEVVTGTTPKTAQRNFYDGGVFNFIAPGDLGVTTKIYRSEKFLTESGLSESRVLPKNTVCFVCIGSTIGKVGITTQERSATNQQINSIIVNDEFDPFFVCYLLSYFSDYISTFSSPSPVPIMSKGKFQQVIIYSSRNKDEQCEIAKILSAIDAKIETHQSKEATLQELFKTLLNHLMTGEIRVTDPDIDVTEIQS